VSDLLPATDGLFLGSDTKRWDGSKLINLPSGGNHNILSATHLDTLADTVVAGDLLYGNATPKWARLPKSADGKYLKLISGLPAWADPPAGADHNLLSATHPDTLAGSPVRGDILIGNATPKWSKLAVGLANRILKTDGLDPLWGLVVNENVDASAAIVESKLALNYPTHSNALDHARQHALDSAFDHSGTITDTQHGSRGSGLHADSHAQLHKDSHKSGGSDAFVLADLLDCLARLEVKKAGVSIGKRRGLNLIEGANVTLTVADDPGNEEVDVTIASAGGGGGVAKTLLGYWYKNLSYNLTMYYALNDITSQGTEDYAQGAALAGTFKTLKIRIRLNTFNSGNTVFTFCKNGTDTALTISVPYGQTGIFTINSDVAVAENDLIDLKVSTVGPTAGNIGFQPVFVQELS